MSREHAISESERVWNEACGPDAPADDNDGWTVAGCSAQWWDGDDYAKLSLYVPEGVTLTRQIKHMIETAYTRGQEAGIRAGGIAKAAEIRSALGIEQAIEYTLRNGGYVSRFDE